jgi:hypothetical protein
MHSAGSVSLNSMARATHYYYHWTSYSRTQENVFGSAEKVASVEQCLHLRSGLDTVVRLRYIFIQLSRYLSRETKSRDT